MVAIKANVEPYGVINQPVFFKMDYHRPAGQAFSLVEIMIFDNAIL